MKFLKFKYNFWRLKIQFKSFCKIKEKITKKDKEKRKFIKYFIKDEEDKILNREVLEGFDKYIQKYKLKLFKKENKINKILFSLGIVDLNYIDILYNYKISIKDIQIIKNIFKNIYNKI